MGEQPRKRRMPANAIRVCVDRCRDYDAVGRMYSRATGQKAEFTSMTDLLLKADALLDRTKGPQSLQRKRMFRAAKKEEAKRETAGGRPRPEVSEDQLAQIDREEGMYATYDVVVQSRMHASWQGFVRDGDGAFLGSFESEMQMMELIVGELYGRDR